MSPRSAFSSSALLVLSGVTFLAACGGGGGESGSPSGLIAPVPSVSLDLKQFRFTWDAVQGASTYRVLENADGQSGLSPVWQGTGTTYSHIVPLYDRLDASYVVEACNGSGCAQSDEWFVTGTLVDAVGYVKASNPAAWSTFGRTVVLSDDGRTMLVGALHAGLSYLFTEEEGAWSQAQLIDPPTPNDPDRPSLDVALSGDGNVVAAFSKGAIRLFERTGNSWQLRDTVVVLEGEVTSVRVPIFLSEDGTTLAAGVNGDAYIYVRAGDSWELQTALAGKGDGLALSADGSLLATAGHSASTVEIHARNAGVWALQGSIPLSVGHGPVLSFADQGRMLAIGASEESSGAQGIDSNDADTSAYKAGAVFVYKRTDGSWVRDAYIKASNAEAHDRFGYAVDLNADGTLLVVGAYGEDGSATGLNGVPDNAAGPVNSDGGSAGAAYVFTRKAGAWAQLAYLKATNTRGYAEYGRSVAISGNGQVIAVGDDYEASASAGIGGDDSDDSAYAAGAVFLY